MRVVAVDLGRIQEEGLAGVRIVDGPSGGGAYLVFGRDGNDWEADREADAATLNTWNGPESELAGYVVPFPPLDVRANLAALTGFGETAMWVRAATADEVEAVAEHETLGVAVRTEHADALRAALDFELEFGLLAAPDQTGASLVAWVGQAYREEWTPREMARHLMEGEPTVEVPAEDTGLRWIAWI
jgi:hypothetical protein